MLAVDAIQLAEATVRDLRAQGQDERARAIERLLSVVVVALGGEQAGAPPAYLTSVQAARMLGGSPRLIRQLVDQGDLEAERFGARLLISHDAILAYLQRAASVRPSVPEATPAQIAERTRLHHQVVKGLSAEAVARQQALLDRPEIGERLSKAERAELLALERDLAAAASTRLQRWVEQANHRQP
jgi:excisionase family DNA binding protein